MIEARRQQLSFGDGLIAETVVELYEPWMKHADELLNDEKLIETTYEALLRRRPKSRSRGRLGTPAEVVLRLLILKHVRQWSYHVLEREVRANLVYREFTRVGGGKVPDAKTMGRFGLALGPEVIEELHQRVVRIAQDKKVIKGKKLRVDTTVVETNIHYPTDSTLLGDGVRVLTRTMKRIAELGGTAGAKLRDRSRSVRNRIIEIGRASRSKGEQGKEKLKQAYEKLLQATGRVVGQAKRFAKDVAVGVKRSQDVLTQAVLDGLRKELETIVPRVEQIMRQARARIFSQETRSEGKLVSIFEPTTEIIRKGKAGKPTEFGKMLKVQEAENQIVTKYEVYAERPADSALLVPAIEAHRQRLGCLPELVAGDAGFYSAKGEAAAQKMGVKRVSVPNRSSKSADRKKYQRQRWFRNGQKWRTGCEGRISVLKRRHGLGRSRYKGDSGMKRWVGLGVIGDNLINIGRHLAAQAK